MRYMIGPRRWHRRPFGRPFRPFYPRRFGRRWLGCFPLLILAACMALAILARAF